MNRRHLAFVMILALAACGGGGGGGTSGGGGGGGVIVTPPTAGPTQALLLIQIPSVGPSGTKRPLFVDPNTNSIGISINGTPVPAAAVTTACNTLLPMVCSATVAAPAGTDTFDIVLGVGSTAQSHGTVTAAIPANQTTTIHLTFHGIVASAKIVSDAPYPNVGAAAVEHLTLVAYDAAGSQIIGDDYDAPIVISNGDTTGHVSLAGTSFRNPTDSIVLNYDGHLMAHPATISIATAGVTTTIPFQTLGNPYTTYGPLSGLAFNVAAGANGSAWFVECTQFPGPCKPGFVDRNGSVNEFAAVPALNSAALGPDGNEWYTGGGQPYIYRVTPAGAETAFLVRTLLPNEGFDTTAITAGPDGNMWFDEDDKIGKITPSGTVTEYPLDALYRPQSIVAGPDGRLWFDNGPEIGAIATDGTRTYYPIAGGARSSRVIFDFGGLLYFNPSRGTGYQTMTTSGVQGTFASSQPGGSGWPIVGPGGNIWDFIYTGSTSTPYSIGLGFISPSGATTFYPFNPSQTVAYGNGLALSTDGNVWTAGSNSSNGFPSNGITRFRYYP